MELLVVVLIIGILATVAVPQYKYAVNKTKYQKVIAVADAIYKSQLVFYTEHGYYTTNFKELILDISGVTYERKTSEGAVWAQRFLGNKVECVLTTDSMVTTSTKVTCSTEVGPLYGIWYSEPSVPRACISKNEKQENFCKRITGKQKTDGWKWGTYWVWPF
ncbi:MAG: hypothetical protein J6Q05_04940 [Elusimicrobiaceae bacterium]|nr:hypothetical protein [Elusimicrobiaceae bacterium]